MPVICKFCERGFSNQSNHNRHINEVHKQIAEPVSYGKVWSSRCLEPNCNRSFSNNKNLMQHLHNDHSMKFETEPHVFKNTNDFEKWKKEIEVTNGCYVLKSKYASTVGEVIYFKCNRSKNSYKIKEIGQRSRSLKSQGSCKMDHSCTSEIRVTKENTKIIVDWQKVHYGHDLDMQHIRLPKVEKEIIVTKMVANQFKPVSNSIVDNISKGLLTLSDNKSKSSNEKICYIKDSALRLGCLDFEQFDDEIINKIHYHLMIARNLTNCSDSNISNNKFEISNSSKKKLIEPQMRFTSTKKKCMKSKTSLKRTTLQEAFTIKENLNHPCKDSFLYKSVDPLNDHQYC